MLYRTEYRLLVNGVEKLRQVDTRDLIDDFVRYVAEPTDELVIEHRAITVGEWALTTPARPIARCCDGTGYTGNMRERCPDHFEPLPSPWGGA